MTTPSKADIATEFWNIVKADSLAASRIGSPSRHTQDKLEALITTTLTQYKDELLAKINSDVATYETNAGRIFLDADQVTTIIKGSTQ